MSAWLQVFHLFPGFAKLSLPCKILQGKENFENSRKSGKQLARGLSVVLILADFAKIHLKRNSILTFPIPGGCHDKE